jgi:hypothetical protein
VLKKFIIHIGVIGLTIILMGLIPFILSFTSIRWVADYSFKKANITLIKSKSNPTESNLIKFNYYSKLAECIYRNIGDSIMERNVYRLSYGIPGYVYDKSNVPVYSYLLYIP